VFSPKATQNWRHWEAFCEKSSAQIERKQASAYGERATNI
jgi:hypothetical protein